MRRLSKKILPPMLAVVLATPLIGCEYFRGWMLRPQYKAAEKAFNRGEYALAASRYESLSDRYPDGPRRQQMMVNQAVSLYTLGSYHDARDTFHTYLREYPEGSYAADAREHLKMIDTLMAPANPVREEALKEAKNDLGKLNQLYLQHPHDPAVMFAIGNLYWEMGNAQEAVRYYYMANENDAAYREKTLIKQRMMIDANGKPVPQTPEAIARMEKERMPLVVFDTADYNARDRKEFTGGNERFYVVTGLVRNQSSRLMHSVDVEVRFLNANHQILDVAVAHLGTMSPGAVRAFRVQADSYDNLYNIESYVCAPRGGS